jgi:hypothetical protein
MPNCVTVARQNPVGVTERTLLATFNFRALEPGNYIWNMLGSSCPAYHYIKLEDGQNLSDVDDSTSVGFTVYDSDTSTPGSSGPGSTPTPTHSSNATSYGPNQASKATGAGKKVLGASTVSNASTSANPKALSSSRTPSTAENPAAHSTNITPVKLVARLADTHNSLPWLIICSLIVLGILISAHSWWMRVRK